MGESRTTVSAIRCIGTYNSTALTHWYDESLQCLLRNSAFCTFPKMFSTFPNFFGSLIFSVYKEKLTLSNWVGLNFCHLLKVNKLKRESFKIVVGKAENAGNQLSSFTHNVFSPSETKFII